MLLGVDSTLSACLLLQFEILSLNEFILHRKLILLSHTSMRTEVLDRVLDILGLLEAVGGGDFVIKVNFFLVEDESVASCDDITFHVDEVASPVDKASILIIKLSIRSLENDEIAIGVSFKLSKNLLHIEVGQLSHSPPSQPLALPLAIFTGHLGLIEG